MKALVLKAYNQLVYEDVPDPEVGDEALIRGKGLRNLWQRYVRHGRQHVKANTP